MGCFKDIKPNIKTMNNDKLDKLLHQERRTKQVPLSIHMKQMYIGDFYKEKHLMDWTLKKLYERVTAGT